MAVGSVSSLGIGSGLDLQNILDGLKDADSASIRSMETQKEGLELRLEDFDVVNSQLLSIKSNALNLSLSSNFIERNVSVSNENVLSATVVSGTKEMNHTVEVNKLASHSSWQSEGLAAKDEGFVSADTTFSYKLGSTGESVTLDVAANTTLEDLAEQINNDENNPGVTDTIADVGFGDTPYRLVLTADKSGEDNRIFIETPMAELEMTENQGAGNLPPTSDNMVTVSAVAPLEISLANSNNTIVFQESLDGETVTKLTATIADGTYSSGADVATAMEAAFEAASQADGSAIDYTVSYDETTQKFSISEENGSRLQEMHLLWGNSNAAATLGFDAETDSYTPVASSLNASITANGITYQRQSNDGIDDIIQGVTLNLSGTGNTSLNVASNTENIKTQITELVNSVSELTRIIDEKSDYNLDDGTKGSLAGVSSITRMDDDILALLGTSINTGGDITSLYDLGFSTNRDGSITLDESVLDEALRSHPEDIMKLFAGDEEAGFTGLAEMLNETLRSYTSAEGIVDNEKQSTQEAVNRLENQIEENTDRLDSRYEALTNQFVQLDLQMQRMQSQSDYLASIFGTDKDSDS
jgi:flagellar hook-associated protein 2